MDHLDHARIARDAAGRLRGDADATFEHGLARLLGIFQDWFIARRRARHFGGISGCKPAREPAQ